MEFNTLKSSTLSELYQLLEERKKEQLNLRIQRATTPADVKPHRIREVRRDIAKIKTRLSQLKAGKGA